MAVHTWFVKSKELYLKANELNDKLDFIESCLDKNTQSEILELESEIEYIEEQNEAEYHDLFRISNKNENFDILITSKKVCLDFINNNEIFYSRFSLDSDEKAKEYWLSQLDEFWNKYPNGLIYFV